MKKRCLVALVCCHFSWCAVADDSIFESGPMRVLLDGGVDASTMIDTLVRARLEALDMDPANESSDEVFIRRAYLVAIGTLPREDEVRDFLATEDEVKRTLVIEHLLNRPEFADYWSMKWGGPTSDQS